MSRRTDRIASLIQTELGEAIVKKLKDPRIGFVTVTRVNVTPDLKLASVHYSVMGGKSEKRGAGQALEHAAGFLQHEIAVALKLRFTPKLKFQLDESLEESIRIQQIISHIEQEGQTPDSGRNE